MTYMGHFINNAQGGKTAEWMMQSQWKICQLQSKTWGSSTCVCYFPCVRHFELMNVRHGVCRRLGYCDVFFFYKPHEHRKQESITRPLYRKHTTNNESTCNNTGVYISINNVFATPNTKYKETKLSAFLTKIRNNKYQHITSNTAGLLSS
jgi:hypothetical protein